jgi:hypothetical protein
MTKKLPTMIFVKWDEPTNGEFYLITSDELRGLVDTGREKSRIGTYQLVETVDAEMIVSTSKPIKSPTKSKKTR